MCRETRSQTRAENQNQNQPSTSLSAAINLELPQAAWSTKGRSDHTRHSAKDSNTYINAPGTRTVVEGIDNGSSGCGRRSNTNDSGDSAVLEDVGDSSSDTESESMLDGDSTTTSSWSSSSGQSSGEERMDYVGDAEDSGGLVAKVDRGRGDCMNCDCDLHGSMEDGEEEEDGGRKLRSRTANTTPEKHWVIIALVLFP